MYTAKGSRSQKQFAYGRKKSVPREYILLFHLHEVLEHVKLICGRKKLR